MTKSRKDFDILLKAFFLFPSNFQIAVTLLKFTIMALWDTLMSLSLAIMSYNSCTGCKKEHCTRMMEKVFGGMMVLGILVLQKHQISMLTWIMMENVFQTFFIKNGNCQIVHISMELKTRSQSNVALNQKV